MNQRIDESAAIAATVQLYSDGVRDGNIDLLRTAFHPKAMMFSGGENPMVLEMKACMLSFKPMSHR